MTVYTFYTLHTLNYPCVVSWCCDCRWKPGNEF